MLKLTISHQLYDKSLRDLTRPGKKLQTM